jgi:hypothetical protein
VARDLLLRLVDPSAQGSAAAPADSPYPAYPAAVADATGPLQATGGPTLPRDLPAGQTEPVSASGRSRRGSILAAGAAAVVAALVIGGVLLLTRSPSRGHPSAAGSSGAGHTTSPGALRTTTPAPPAAQVAGRGIPAAFAGTWSGTASLTPLGVSGVALSNPVTFTFVAGGRTAHEVNQDCTNVLTLTRATATVLTFSEPQTPSCKAGTVTFTRRARGLAYRWLDIDNLEQNTAILRKSA